MIYRLLLVITVAAGLFGFSGDRAAARSFSSDAVQFARTLGAAERKTFERYIAARKAFNAKRDAFWRKVSQVRAKRKKRRRAGHPLRAGDYVNAYPPEYSGPTLSKSLAGRWKAFRAKLDVKKPTPARQELPRVKNFVAYARKYYGFVAERISEKEFKRRYAREALRFGLSKDQVVRVYALETGGYGTADMQAGIHPISKKGRPISSALGYAQLLTANSIGELVKHGKSFIARLDRMARQHSISEARRAQLRAKIASVRKMLRHARSVPNKWSRHVAMARTARGQGIHAINLDGDIGPWLQVIKLHGIKDMAARKGRANIASHQLELMNLAGPGTGLEMMTAVGLDMPTVNFFSRRGYERNSIVRGKTSRGLLAALRERMDVNVKNKGAIEFNAVFDSLMAP